MMEERTFVYFYNDEGCSKRVTTIRNDEKVNAGKEGSWTLYARNITGHELVNITFTSSDEDLEVNPSEIARMEPHQVIEVIFTFRPKLNRKDPLSAKLGSVATEVRRPRW